MRLFFEAAGRHGFLTDGATFTTLDVPRSINPDLVFSNGQVTLQFTGALAGNYTVLSTTNLALPLTNWTSLGSPVLTSNNLYRFTTPATNAVRYYLLKE